MNKWVIGILVAVLLVGGWFVSAYNSFVGVNEGVATAWSQVENVYQRRLDLIPNLIETVKGITKQEQAVFLGVTEARAKVGQFTLTQEMLDNPETLKKFQAAQGELGGTLTKLFAVSENYPQLKSNENFLALQSELEGTENRVAVERKRFNDAVLAYNLKAKAIPGKWLVSWFGFDAQKALFAADAEAKTVPKVKF